MNAVEHKPSKTLLNLARMAIMNRVLAIIASSFLLIGSPAVAVQDPTSVLAVVDYFYQVTAKFLETNTAFTADAEMRFTPANRKPSVYLTKVAIRENFVRWDMDMNKSPQIPEDRKPLLGEQKMDQLAFVVRAKENIGYAIFPKLRSYVQIAFPNAAVVSDEKVKSVGLQKTFIGEEVFDGHRCSKQKVLLINQGPKEEAVVWYAVELGGFPVRIEAASQAGSASYQFKGVRLSEPDAKLFEAPEGFKQYKSFQEMMQANQAGLPK
jgi:hypothetical protein